MQWCTGMNEHRRMILSSCR